MRATHILTLVASLASGALAEGVGTIETFTEGLCSGAPEKITVPDENSSGSIPAGVHSVKPHLSGCTCKSPPDPEDRPSISLYPDPLVVGERSIKKGNGG